MIENNTKDLSQEQIVEAINNAAVNLRDEYVFADGGQKLHDGLLEKLANGEYKGEFNTEEFCSKITEDLRSIINDGHLYVRHIPPATKAEIEAAEKAKAEIDTELEDRRQAEMLKQQNHGFYDMRILREGLGYVRIDNFQGTDAAFKRANAMFEYFDECTGIIIDLRWCGGGDGRMGHLLATYFFAANDSKWLLSNENRAEGTLVQEYTLPFVPGRKRPECKLYFLQSKNSFSAAEAVTYAMQAYDACTIIGEYSGGGAHSGNMRDIGSDLKIFMPSGHITSPVTKSNWEGVGVKPDIEVPKTECFRTAIKTHLEFLKTQDDCPIRQTNLDWQLEYFTAEKTETPAAELLENCTGEFSGNRKVFVLDGELYVKQANKDIHHLQYLKDDAFYYATEDMGESRTGARYIFKGFKTGKAEAIELQTLQPGIAPVQAVTVDRA